MKPQVFFCKVCGAKMSYDDDVCPLQESERERLEKEWMENHPSWKKMQQEAAFIIGYLCEREKPYFWLQ
jgi:hypothetical protein